MSAGDLRGSTIAEAGKTVAASNDSGPAEAALKPLDTVGSNVESKSTLLHVVKALGSIGTVAVQAKNPVLAHEARLKAGETVTNWAEMSAKQGGAAKLEGLPVAAAKQDLKAAAKFFRTDGEDERAAKAEYAGHRLDALSGGNG